MNDATCGEQGAGMDWGEVAKVITTVGGISVIVAACIALVGNILLERLRASLTQHQRISDAQFEKYADLWNQLQELRLAADHLWEEADRTNLQRFATVLGETRFAIEAGRLILEEEHYEQLCLVLKGFENFHLGKQKVFTMREAFSEIRSDRTSEAQTTLAYVDQERPEITDQIRENEKYKRDYEELLDRVVRNMRSQLGLKSRSKES
jgi:hypothetical protein